MFISDLKSRNYKILEAIILAYAESAIPIGSEYLRHSYKFGVSPATIRNVMADLEEQGLVTHPHTSAGRVPTDRGYRYYVDLLMEPVRVKPEEEAAFNNFSHIKGEDEIELLHHAAGLLSELTHEAGIVLVPQLAQGSFRHLELILMDATEIVGVLIASEGMVRHARLDLQEAVNEEEVERIERFLNQELAGMPLAQIHSYLERSILQSTSAFFHLYKRAMDLLAEGPFFDEKSSILLEGTNWLFEAPEFQDIQRMRRLIRGLENQTELMELLRRDVAADEVKLHIGSENRATYLADCTIVAAPYRLHGGVSGAIGVIGPTRMNYPHVTVLVGKMAQAVSRAFQEQE